MERHLVRRHVRSPNASYRERPACHHRSDLVIPALERPRLDEELECLLQGLAERLVRWDPGPDDVIEDFAEKVDHPALDREIRIASPYSFTTVQRRLAVISRQSSPCRSASPSVFRSSDIRR